MLDFIYHLQAKYKQIIGTTEKTNDILYQVEISQPTALVMGSEQKGIYPTIIKIADDKIKLPFLGDIASINVFETCGEVVRQKKS